MANAGRSVCVLETFGLQPSRVLSLRSATRPRVVPVRPFVLCRLFFDSSTLVPRSLIRACSDDRCYACSNFALSVFAIYHSALLRKTSIETTKSLSGIPGRLGPSHLRFHLDPGASSASSFFALGQSLKLKPLPCLFRNKTLPRSSVCCRPNVTVICWSCP